MFIQKRNNKVADDWSKRDEEVADDWTTRNYKVADDWSKRDEEVAYDWSTRNNSATDDDESMINILSIFKCILFQYRNSSVSCVVCSYLQISHVYIMRLERYS